jgi:hypothetical protein
MKTWAITCDIYTLYIQEDMTMANINDLASKIVSRMNQLDSNPNDNYIDAKIWKDYAVQMYGAKDNVTIKISVFNATASIKKYLDRESKATGESVDKIATKWYDDLVDIKSNPQISNQQNINQSAANTVSSSKIKGDTVTKKEYLVNKMHNKWSSAFRQSPLGKDFYSRLYDVIKEMHCSVRDCDFNRKNYSSKEEQTMDEVIAVLAGESSLNPKSSGADGKYRGLFQLDRPSLQTVKDAAIDYKIPGINQKISLNGFAKLPGVKQLDYLKCHIANARRKSGLSQTETITPGQLWAMIKKPKYGQEYSTLTAQKNKQINKTFIKNDIERGIA